MYLGPNFVCILCFIACLEYSTITPRSHNKLSSSSINLRKLVTVNKRKNNNPINYANIHPHNTTNSIDVRRPNTYTELILINVYHYKTLYPFSKALIHSAPQIKLWGR